MEKATRPPLFRSSNHRTSSVHALRVLCIHHVSASQSAAWARAVSSCGPVDHVSWGARLSFPGPSRGLVLLDVGSRGFASSATS